jgi:hypothetical protein
MSGDNDVVCVMWICVVVCAEWLGIRHALLRTLALAGASGSLGGRPQTVGEALGPKGPTNLTNPRPEGA